jgi:hypothetical protein
LHQYRWEQKLFRGGICQSKSYNEQTFPESHSYEIPEIKDGVYVISSALQSNKVLDIVRSSTHNGANLQLWSRNGTNAQKFKVTYQNDGSYVLEPVCSHKRIDVCCRRKNLGTNIWQYENNGTDAQKWYIIPAGKGYYNIFPPATIFVQMLTGQKPTMERIYAAGNSTEQIHKNSNLKKSDKTALDLTLYIM